MDNHEHDALLKLRDAYVAGKPVMETIMAEHQRAQAVLNLFTSSILLGSDAHTPAAGIILANIDIVQKYMSMTLGAVTMMHGTAKMVSSILSEHEVCDEGGGNVH